MTIPQPTEPTFGTGTAPTDTGPETPRSAPSYRSSNAHPYPPTAASTDERTWAMLAHLGALGLIVLTGVLGVVAPIVAVAVRGNDSAFVRRHAMESLNFQITLLLVGVVGTLVAVVGTVLTLGLGLIVIGPAILAYVVFALVVMIKASVRANQGLDYTYPLTIRFVR